MGAKHKVAYSQNALFLFDLGVVCVFLLINVSLSITNIHQ